MLSQLADRELDAVLRVYLDHVILGPQNVGDEYGCLLVIWRTALEAVWDGNSRAVSQPLDMVGDTSAKGCEILAGEDRHDHLFFFAADLGGREVIGGAEMEPALA